MKTKTYTVLFAQDVPHYGAVDIEATGPVAALTAARGMDLADITNDPDWNYPVCRRIVHIEDDGGHVNRLPSALRTNCAPARHPGRVRDRRHALAAGCFPRPMTFQNVVHLPAVHPVGSGVGSPRKRQMVAV